jgi:hypothetical protein
MVDSTQVNVTRNAGCTEPQHLNDIGALDSRASCDEMDIGTSSHKSA